MTNPEEMDVSASEDDCAMCFHCQLDDIRKVIDMLSERIDYLEDKLQTQTALMTGMMRVFRKAPKCVKKKVKA